MEQPGTTATPETPAPTPAPTMSATRAAADKGDFSAFLEADDAASKGTPMARVEVKPDPAPVKVETPAVEAQPPAQTVSKRQQDINDRIREAVSKATADLAAENARLRGQQPQQPQQPTTPKEPEWKRFASMPEAPRLAEFDSVEDHAAAMALFIADTRHAERTQAEQAKAHQSQRERFLTERSEKYGTALHQAQASDPDFLSKIPPALVTARPLSGLSAEERKTATFANSAAEAAFRSDAPDVLLKYLHANQDEVVAIARLHPSEWLPSLLRLDGRLSASTSTPTPAPSAPAPSPISAAPQPVPALTRAGASTDPQAAALARGDFAAWEKHETAKDRARRGVA